MFEEEMRKAKDEHARVAAELRSEGDKKDINISELDQEVNRLKSAEDPSDIEETLSL